MNFKTYKTPTIIYGITSIFFFVAGILNILFFYVGLIPYSFLLSYLSGILWYHYRFKKNISISIIGMVYYSFFLYLLGLIIYYIIIDSKNFHYVTKLPLDYLMLILSNLPFLVISYFLKFFRERFLNKDKIASDEKKIENFLFSILNSDKFLKAFNEVLPTGKDDEKYGLDHIPYMLNAINNKRKELARHAQRFLNITIILGVMFSCILLIFAFVILDDRFTGIGRKLSRLEESSNQIETEISKFNENLALNSFSSISNEIEKLISITNRYNTKKTEDFKYVNSFLSIMNKATKEDDNDLVVRTMKKISTSKILQPFPDSIKDEINEIIDKIDRLTPDIFLTKMNLLFILNSNKEIIESLEQKMELEQNKISNLISRIGLTIAISGFFLAIIKYSARIYQQYQRQVFLADQEDMMIRQFYVALKSAKDNKDAITVVLQEFMKMRNDVVDEKTNISADSSKLAKEILNAMMKKI